MAKDRRINIQFRCEKCGSINYWSKKNKMNTTDKLELNKFCSKCRKSTKHKEEKPKKK